MVGGGVDVEGAGAFQEEGHLPEGVARAQDVDDGVAVADFEGAVEHDEDVACGTAALEHTISLRAFDDRAACNATLSLVVGEPVEGRHLLCVEFVEGAADLAPVVLGRGERLAADRRSSSEHCLNTGREFTGWGGRSQPAQRLGVGDERDERDEVSRRRAVDVVGRVRTLAHLQVERQEMRLATTEHQTQVLHVGDRAAVAQQLVEHARSAMGREHRVALADAHHVGRELREERGELVLVDLTIRKAVTTPRHARRGYDLVAVPGVADPAVFVFGFREPAVVTAGDVVIPLHLLHVDRIPKPLHSLDVGDGRRLLELVTHRVQSVACSIAAFGADCHTFAVGRTPSGTVTFLFTDIEGSTHLWEEQPEAMRAALARHDELLRTAVAAHGGTIVKTTGDGAHVAFPTAADGVLAAIDAQRALGAECWPAEAPISARMGVHTGEAEERDGDYYGAAVNRAARIMSIGHGGQILISDAAAAVLRDERSITMRDLGEHRLRDLSRPERVHQVVAVDLAADFPRLRSLDALPTNLPSQLATFVGREAELNRVGNAVAEHRLVTLTGVGGVGKTRLALQLAADVVAEFRDGAWVSELAPAGEADAMLGIIATTFKVQQRVGSTLDESIVEALRSRELLWVVDNCEHLIEPVARLVDRVLAYSSRRAGSRNEPGGA